MVNSRKIIIAVTGASGAIYAESLFERIHSLQDTPAEVAIVFTKQAEDIWNFELNSDGPPRWRGSPSVHRSTCAEAEDPCHDTKDDVSSRKQEKDKGESVFRVYDNNNFYAPFASGSSSFDTMIVCPASMGMLGRIANGVSDDLITRAADVMLKERRKLIIVPRETPYSLIHINNMKLLTEAGAVIMPATPSFYSKPETIKDLVLTVVDRILDHAGFGIDTKRWQE